MLFGQGQYATIAAQINYDPAVHAQIGAAVVRAWKALPNKAAGDQLSKVVQGFSEPYSEFVSHLIQLAGKIFGDADTATPVIKQLAFENANKYCKEALRAHKDKSLNDMIRLCRDIDVNHITGQVLVAAIRQGFGRDPGARPKAFAYLGVPNLIKTDNGPAYASQGFQKFCKRWSIQHKTGIPYNPQDAERPMWLPEHCVYPVDVPADTKDHEDDPDSTNIGTVAMDVGPRSTRSPLHHKEHPDAIGLEGPRSTQTPLDQEDPGVTKRYWTKRTQEYPRRHWTRRSQKHP
ncbi:hypothetical protein STEG23_034912 [Scotinomys teguina]